MAENDKKTRIQVSISNQLLDMLDTYCKAIGVSRSAFIQTILGQTLYSINRVQSAVPDVLTAAVERAAEMDGGERPAGL